MAIYKQFKTKLVGDLRVRPLARPERHSKKIDNNYYINNLISLSVSSCFAFYPHPSIKNVLSSGLILQVILNYLASSVCSCTNRGGKNCTPDDTLNTLRLRPWLTGSTVHARTWLSSARRPRTPASWPLRIKIPHAAAGRPLQCARVQIKYHLTALAHGGTWLLRNEWAFCS